MSSLFELQDRLIEHKYPITGIWEALVTDAGDIYRELTKQEPHYIYLAEKGRSLQDFIMRKPLNNADFREFREYTKETREYPNFIQERSNYLINLQKLKQATEIAKIEPKKKRTMIFSLDLIRALVLYYEKTVYDVPEIEWVNLREALNLLFPGFSEDVL